MNENHNLPTASTGDHTDTTVALPETNLLQTIGLAPSVAVSAILVDLLLSSADLVSMGLLLPFSFASAAALGFVTYKWQRKWGDDNDGAMVKAVLIALVTAIPVPLTPIVAGPAGLAGLIRNFSRK